MDKREARRIVDNEDYLPWALVAEAKKVLGIKEQTAAELWAELNVKRVLEERLALAVKLNRPASEIEDLRGQLAAHGTAPPTPP